MNNGFLQGASVVIPCLNEAETIAKAVSEARAGLVSAGMQGEVIVADNGSTDGSQDLAISAGARVVAVRLRGYGAALHEGISDAKFSWVVFADADLSYPFIEMKNILAPLASGRADFVLGSRLRGKMQSGAMPFLNRHLGTPVLSFLIRVIYGLQVSDCNSGMRAMRSEIYAPLKLCCPGMEYASEMLIRVAEEKFRYEEATINFRKDQRTRAPHLRRWRDGWRHLRFILGNSPSVSVIFGPALIATVFLITAYILSFENLFLPSSKLHYHSAFLLIGLSEPLYIFTIMALLLKASRHNANLRQSRLIAMLDRWAENSAPFYVSCFFFALAFAEIFVLFLRWRQNDYAFLAELPSAIRISTLFTVGATILSLDMGLGLLKILPYRKYE